MKQASSKRLDVAAVVLGHSEGSMLAASIGSAAKAIRMLCEVGGEAELIVALDRADGATREAAREALSAHSSEFLTRVIELDVGDSGEARMAAVRSSEARNVALLDGDDLWGPSWLAKAWLQSCQEPSDDFVLHPQLTRVFGDRSTTWFHENWIETPASVAALFGQNPWTALSFFPRSLALRIPWTASRRELGFGFEDWHWHCETVARGVRHAVVSDSVHFVRSRRHSRSDSHRRESALLAPTSLASYDRLAWLLASRADVPVTPWRGLALETALRERTRAAGSRSEALLWRLGAAAIDRSRKRFEFPREPEEALPLFAAREAEELSSLETTLPSANDLAPVARLNRAVDPEGSFAFARWSLAFEGASSVSIGDPEFIRTSVGRDGAASLTIVRSNSPLAPSRSGDGLVLSDARLNWLARALIQARPRMVRLRRGIPATDRLLELFGSALRSNLHLLDEPNARPI